MVLALAAPAFAQIGYDAPSSNEELSSVENNGAEIEVELYAYEKSEDGTYEEFDSEDGVLANEDLRFVVKVKLPTQESNYCDLKNPCKLEVVVNNISYAPTVDEEGTECGDSVLAFEATSAEGVYAANLEYAPETVEKGGSFTYMFTTQALTASTVTVNATLSGGRKELPMRFAYDGKVYDIEGVEKENFTVYVDNSYGMVINVDSDSKVSGLQIFTAEHANKFFDVVISGGNVEFKSSDESYKKGDAGYDALYAEYESIMDVLGFSEGETAYVYTNALVNRFNTAFSFAASQTFQKAGTIPTPATSGNSIVFGFVVIVAAVAVAASFFFKKLRTI